MWKRMKFLKGENCSLVTEKKALSTNILTGKTKESGFAMLSIQTILRQVEQKQKLLQNEM